MSIYAISDDFGENNSADRLLEIKHLNIQFKTDEGTVHAVNDLSFSLKKGENLGIVGESGSGKSVTALSIIRLIAMPPGKITSGEILFNEEDLLKKKPDEIRKIRGNRISMIFQDPMTSLNPLLTAGDQIVEAILLHQKVNKKEAFLIATEMMRKVKIPDPGARMHVYPHEFSGGMRQRIMIAMALCCNPDLLIADEPTTALDVTIQAQILHLMRELNSNSGSSIILITHDLGIVSEVCQNVMVMYGGEAVEYAPVTEIFKNPAHPYTCGLLASRPKLNDKEKKPLVPVAGYPPDLFSPPRGCTFYPRCKYGTDRCNEERISLETLSPGHSVRCIRAKELYK